jgi:hypothetical protein
MEHVSSVEFFAMTRMIAVALACCLISCTTERYDTKTVDGVTLRIDKTTGTTHILRSGRWVEVREPVIESSPASAQTIALTEDRRGQPCKSAANWIDEALDTGCTPNRSARTY